MESTEKVTIKPCLPEHAHYWVYEDNTPGKAQIRGVCKYCEQTREDPAMLDIEGWYETWKLPGSPDKRAQEEQKDGS